MHNNTLHNITYETYDAVMQSYPIFRDDYREILNRHIFDYYEDIPIAIGSTPIWLRRLSARMAVIMPKYNLLFDSLELVDKIDPLMTYEGWEENDHEGEKHSTDDGTKDYDKDNTSTVTEGQTKTSQEVMDDDTTEHQTTNEVMHDEQVGTKHFTDYAYRYFSDTPQGNLAGSGIDGNYGSSDSPMLAYLTTWEHTTEEYDERSTLVEDKTTDTVRDTVGTDDRTTDYKENIDKTTGTVANETYGHTTTDKYDYNDENHDKMHKLGTDTDSLSTLIAKYRELAINIENDIIAELDDLFQTVFDMADLIGSSNYDYKFHNPWIWGRGVWI